MSLLDKLKKNSTIKYEYYLKKGNKYINNVPQNIVFLQ